jgi:hypothetical protein
MRVSDHPIWCLWASKRHDMGNIGLSDTDRYSAAHSDCMALAADGAMISYLLSTAEQA